MNDKLSEISRPVACFSHEPKIGPMSHAEERGREMEDTLGPYA